MSVWLTFIARPSCHFYQVNNYAFAKCIIVEVVELNLAPAPYLAPQATSTVATMTLSRKKRIAENVEVSVAHVQYPPLCQFYAFNNYGFRKCIIVDTVEINSALAPCLERTEQIERVTAAVLSFCRASPMGPSNSSSLCNAQDGKPAMSKYLSTLPRL